MLISELSFHAGEGAVVVSDCCPRAPKVEANKINKAIGATILKCISSSGVSRITLPAQCAVAVISGGARLRRTAETSLHPCSTQERDHHFASCPAQAMLWTRGRRMAQ